MCKVPDSVVCYECMYACMHVCIYEYVYACVYVRAGGAVVCAKFQILLCVMYV